MTAKSHLETYRRLITLKDGARLLLRLLTADDGDKLIELYTSAQPEDWEALRHNMEDPSAVHAWLDELDYNRVLPLGALINDRIVGNVTLHRRATGPYRHIGELRIFLAKDFRGRALGTEMLRTMIDLARKEGLHVLRGEVLVRQAKFIRALQALGFEQQCVLQDYFMLPDGQTEDVSLLLMRLLKQGDEF